MGPGLGWQARNKHESCEERGQDRKNDSFRLVGKYMMRGILVSLYVQGGLETPKIVIFGKKFECLR